MSEEPQYKSVTCQDCGSDQIRLIVPVEADLECTELGQFRLLCSSCMAVYGFQIASFTVRRQFVRMGIKR